MIETAHARREKAKPAALPARDYRKELWIAVCAGVVSANDCKESATAINWANNVLCAFDRKFREVAP